MADHLPITSPSQPIQQPDAERAPSLVVTAIDHQLAAVQAHAHTLLGEVAARVDGAWEQTQDHSQLLETGVEELHAAAADSVEATNQLLAAAMRLNAELRGIDLVASRVAALRQAVDQMEVQVKAVCSG